MSSIDIEQLVTNLERADSYTSTSEDPQKIYFVFHKENMWSSKSTELIIPNYADFIDISSIQFDHEQQQPLSYSIRYEFYPGIQTAGCFDVPLDTKWFPILINSSLIIDIKDKNVKPKTVQCNYAFCHRHVMQKIQQCKEFSTNLKTYPVLLWEIENENE